MFSSLGEKSFANIVHKTKSKILNKLNTYIVCCQSLITTSLYKKKIIATKPAPILYEAVTSALAIIFSSLAINLATTVFIYTIIIEPPNAIIIRAIVYSQ